MTAALFTSLHRSQKSWMPSAQTSRDGSVSRSMRCKRWKLDFILSSGPFLQRPMTGGTVSIHAELGYRSGAQPSEHRRRMIEVANMINCPGRKVEG